MVTDDEADAKRLEAILAILMDAASAAKTLRLTGMNQP